MTRDQAKENLKALGVEEPTKEQVDAYLNSVGGEINKANENAAKTKELVNSMSARIKELEAELKKTTDANLTDAEKTERTISELQASLAEKEKELTKARSRESLANIGITGEKADKFFDENGNIDFANLGEILNETRSTAAKEKELEFIKDSTPPRPGAGGAGGKDKDTLADRQAKAYIESKKKNQSDFAAFLSR